MGGNSLHEARMEEKIEKEISEIIDSLGTERNNLSAE